MVTVDGRGQMVIPKKVREIANIHGGEKLMVFTLQMEGEACYIFLVKAGNFEKTVGHSWMHLVNKTSGK